jgi:hypothetical protein
VSNATAAASAGGVAAAVAEATIARAIPPAVKTATAAHKAVNPRCAHFKGVRFHGRLFCAPAQSRRSFGKGGSIHLNREWTRINANEAGPKLHSFFNECPLTMIDFDALVTSVD